MYSRGRRAEHSQRADTGFREPVKEGGDGAVKGSEVADYWAWGQGRGSTCEEDCVRETLERYRHLWKGPLSLASL